LVNNTEHISPAGTVLQPSRETYFTEKEELNVIKSSLASSAEGIPTR